MKYLTLISTLFYLNSTNAQTSSSDDMCKLAKTVPSSSTALSVSPSYFISPDPTGKYVGIIGGGNHLVDLETGKMTKVPGSVDPVFTPDGAYLTLPDGIFYNAQDIRVDANEGESTSSPKKVYSGGMSGVYQSIGVKKESDGSTTYRMIDDTSDVSFQDYKRKPGSDSLVQKNKYSRKLCKEFQSDTPMISKDGKYVSIYNSKTLSTQIYNIEDNVNDPDKPCKLVMDLGFPTGKVSFDYENKRIAFHVDSVQTQANYFSGVSSSIRKDSYVMNIDIGKDEDGNETWKASSFAKMNLSKREGKLGTGSYYPRFRKDGSIVTVVQHKTGFAEYSLDVVPTENMNFQPYNEYLYNDKEIARCTEENGKEIYAALALGELWAQACTAYETRLRPKDLLFIPSGMDYYSCVKLIKNAFAKNKFKKVQTGVKNLVGLTERRKKIYKNQEVVNSLTEKDLLAACPPKHQNAGLATNQVGQLTTAKPKNGAEVIEAKCVGCHESSRPDRPFIDFDNPSKADINHMAQLVFNPSEEDKRMPPAEENQLEENEKEMLRKYFLEVLSGEKEWKRPFTE